MRANLRTLLTLMLCLAGTLAAVSCTTEPPLVFTLAFDDEVPRKKGNDVVYKGIRIGKVQSVDLNEGGAVAVVVRIENRHRAIPYREAVYRVARAEGDDKKRYVVRIEDREVAERTPVERGDILEPVEGWESGLLTLDEAKKKTAEAWRALTEGAQNLMDRARTYAESDQAKELRDSMDSFLKDSRERSEEYLRKFREEDYPRLKEQAEAYRQWLMEQDLVEEARKFWEEFLRWSEEVLRGTPESQETATPEGYGKT